ncbi:MAG: NAD(P)/FAD-dependent oxidoreductase, partial [Flavobacteriales bacterium]|nr:NAD(P)/FAD-dependent oxidoreductase [Flavobacteriales bacterium]
GFFTAIQLAERRKHSKILILEKSNKVLSKVKISGGGRCNVTHACFDPQEMVTHYPRGSKELLGPFHRFLCGDMMAWLSEKGIETKIEDDGRVFPVSNSSQTIIDCFIDCCRTHQITIQMQQAVSDIKLKDKKWIINTSSAHFSGKTVMFATGSTPSVWKILENSGYSIIAPVPSLFTFNIKHKFLEGLQGLSMPSAEVEILGTLFKETGPLLITHWGLSGPSILKLSAWAARELHALDYRFTIKVNLLGLPEEHVQEVIQENRKSHPKRIVKKYPQFNLPRRMWERACYVARLFDDNWASLDRKQMDALTQALVANHLKVDGKSTFKEEFVTCGGVERKQIDFKTMESKVHPKLYFAGEVIDIDAITGGFNFQAAWTESFIAAESIAKEI